jgi:hypothetical protein
MARESGTALRGVGRYEILREIGRGGTATVYLARQTDLGRLVALKQLSALQAADASAARRFVRESRLAGSLNHPNIVTVHDFFEDNATPYIAMEYLERGSLRPVVRDLTFAQIAGVLEGLLAGLAHAHELGVVHRDVKPENLLITKDGRVKIADFGIAKATGVVQGTTILTEQGTTIGTPSYMAPEQAMAQGVGPWTDLYATGVIAFELLAGRPPFDTTLAPMAILLQHVNEPPPLLSSVDPSVDPRLSEWIDGLLAKEPEERPQTAGAAWLALEEIVLDRLGSRWRRAARLLEAAPGGATPATLPLADGTRTAGATPATSPLADGTRTAGATPATSPMAHDTRASRRGDPTAMPLSAAPAVAPTAMPLSAAPAAARAGRAARPARGSARRLTRALLLVVVIVAAVAAVVGGSGGGSSPPATGTPAASPSVATTPGPAATATAAPSSVPSGVGDSRSDDPSDDDPDGPEP